jgi:hypothetical protein
MRTIDLERLARLGSFPFTIDVADVLLEQGGIFELQLSISLMGL